LQYHALFYTLLESAILASIPLGFGNFTDTVSYARVDPPILYSPLEEPFAPEKETKF
jgi:hypothetical protein